MGVSSRLRTGRWLVGAIAGMAAVSMAVVPAAANQQSSNQNRPGPSAARPFGDRVIHIPGPRGAARPLLHPGDRVEFDGSCSATPTPRSALDESIFASDPFSHGKCGDSAETYPKWVGMLASTLKPGVHTPSPGVEIEVADGPPWPRVITAPVHVLVPGSGEVHAGDPVEFDGTCTGDAGQKAGPLTSAAVGTVAWQEIGDGVGTARQWHNPVWLGRIKPTIAPGTYSVSFHCPNGTTVTGSVRVVGAEQVPVKPNGAPQTGGGGMSTVVSSWG